MGKDLRAGMRAKPSGVEQNGKEVKTWMGLKRLSIDARAEWSDSVPSRRERMGVGPLIHTHPSPAQPLTMPKIISRSTISSSNDDPQSKTSDASSLRVLYCLCGDFALVCDRPLTALPVRPLDGAHVLRNIDGDASHKKRTIYKISAKQGRIVMLRRSVE